VLNVLDTVLQGSAAAAAAAAGGGLESIHNLVHCPVPYGMYCNLQQQNKNAVLMYNPIQHRTLQYSPGLCRETLKLMLSTSAHRKPLAPQKPQRTKSSYTAQELD
jgi:hypothetical protein